MEFWRSSGALSMEATVCRHPRQWGWVGLGSRRGKLRSEQVGGARASLCLPLRREGEAFRREALCECTPGQRAVSRGSSETSGEGEEGAALPHQDCWGSLGGGAVRKLARALQMRAAIPRLQRRKLRPRQEKGPVQLQQCYNRAQLGPHFGVYLCARVRVRVRAWVPGSLHE